MRWIRRTITFLCTLCFVFLLVLYGPSLYFHIFGEGNTQWIYEQFSELTQEKNELIVYEATLKGQDTVKQDAFLLGTIMQVQIPYTFYIRYSVDLSQCQFSLAGTTIQVSVPTPKASYEKLVVDESQVKKTDWFMHLSTERYGQILSDMETRLFTENATRTDYVTQAKENTRNNLTDLFQHVIQQRNFSDRYDLSIVFHEPTQGDAPL